LLEAHLESLGMLGVVQALDGCLHLQYYEQVVSEPHVLKKVKVKVQNRIQTHSTDTFWQGLARLVVKILPPIHLGQMLQIDQPFRGVDGAQVGPYCLRERANKY